MRSSDADRMHTDGPLDGWATAAFLSLAQSRVDQVEAEIPEARISGIQADQLDEPLWVA
jgi:hypothetical protein